jgi:phospholipid/cholesterol/gamma-HCH transport system substrate-binding protein
MIFGKTKVEMRVGIFVFLGLSILAVFVLSIGSFKSWTSARTVNFVFHFVNGLKLGAPVRYAGVDVGEVRAISLIAPEGEGQIRVKLACRVKKDVQIPVDSVIWVNTLGLLGEKYIEIIPGKNFARVLSETEELNGMDPISMQEVTDMANKLVHNVDDVVKKIKNGEGTVGKLLNDDTIYNDIEALVKDLRKHPWKLFWKTKEKKEDK